MKEQAISGRMEKVLSFIKAADAGARQTLQGRLTGADAGAWLGNALGTSGLTVYLPQPLPGDFPYRPASDNGSTVIGAVPRYDAIVASWHAADALPEVASRWHPLLGELASEVHPYHVNEQHVMDRRKAGEIQCRTLISLLMFHADLPDSAARRSWKLHAPLVDRVHVGATHYVQNWVIAKLDASCPLARGIPQLHFPSYEDLVNGFFDSPRGRDEILQDTSHFVQSGWRFYTVDYPLAV